MATWLKIALKAVLVPGGVIFGVAILLAAKSWLPFSTPGLTFFCYAAFVAAIILALRFLSLRILFAALALLLCQFAMNRVHSLFPGTAAERMALDTIGILLPIDFILLSLIPERVLHRATLMSIGLIVFFESTFVAVFSRPDQPVFGFLHWSPVHGYRARLPQIALLVFLAALTVLFVRLLRFRKSTDHGMFWALLVGLVWLEGGAYGRVSSFYLGIAGVILASSVIENSYSLAYRDELTGLNSRRAFNDALLRLRAPYAIAVVDIDHFKSINDTYGHDTGDQVLRMVASRLAAVTGGGHAYRVGGEEFNILFPGRNAKDIFEHLELLRMNVEACSFRLRGGEDRRKTPRDTERRADSAKHKPKPKSGGVVTGALSVTVSIGIAESKTGWNVEQVIDRADKALYTAKQSGRNRIEIAGEPRKKKPPKIKQPTLF